MCAPQLHSTIRAKTLLTLNEERQQLVHGHVDVVVARHNRLLLALKKLLANCTFATSHFKSKFLFPVLLDMKLPIIEPAIIKLRTLKAVAQKHIERDTCCKSAIGALVFCVWGELDDSPMC